MNFPDQAKRIVGGAESQIIIGNGAYTVLNNMSAFSLYVRADNTVIASITVRDEGGSNRAYSPTWLGVALFQGDYLVSQFPIVAMTLTNAADSVILYCDRP